MKSIRLIIISTIILFICNCSINKNDLINSGDKEKIDLLLSKYKRYAFLDLYRKSIKQEEKKYNIKKCDSLFDISSMELQNEYCLFVDFYSSQHPSYIDENYNKMIKKWLTKDYSPYMPLDNPNIKTVMEYKRALDFYESRDLKNYIDSLRNVYYEKYNKNELKNIDCIRKLE